MKINKIMLALCLIASFASHAFRVTKDHGYGIQTYEDSKGRKGVSVDGGNSWFKTGERTSPATSSFESQSTQELNSRISKLLDSGNVWVVKNASGVTISGKRVNLSEKAKTGKMQIDWNDAPRYVYLRSLNGVSYQRGGKTFFEGVESKVYKIKGKAEIGKPEEFGGTPLKWEKVSGGFLYELVDYAENNP